MKINRCKKKHSQNFSYLTDSRNLWDMRTIINPLSQGSFIAMKKKVSSKMGFHKQTWLNNPYLPLVSPICLLFNYLLTLEAQNHFPFSCHFSIDLLSFVKMVWKPPGLIASLGFFLSFLLALYTYEITIFTPVNLSSVHSILDLWFWT